MEKIKTAHEYEPELVLLDFGKKALTNLNGSKSLIIPKIAWESCGKCTHVSIQLIRTNGEKIIRLVPQKDLGEKQNE